jgi:hypothetical protein
MIFNKTYNLILEKHTTDLYHYTTDTNLSSILLDNHFKLTPFKIASHDELGVYARSNINPRIYPYYISTSRSKTGHYIIGHDGNDVNTIKHTPITPMIHLNGRLLSTRYPIRPVNFHSKYSNKYHQEQEDRIFSRKQFIAPANKFIVDIHIHISTIAIKRKATTAGGLDLLDWVANYDGILRNINWLANKLHIPIYYYHDNVQSFIQQRRSKSSDVYKVEL